MFTQLFFDDQRLFGRDGLTRHYGTPVEEAVYIDGVFSVDFRNPFVFRTESGCFRMIYSGRTKEDGRQIPLIAESSDGIRFTPLNTEKLLNIPERAASNQLLPAGMFSEIACVLENKDASADERYIMLCVGNGEKPLTVSGLSFTSADLIHWQLREDLEPWNGGAEPLAAAFYNRTAECYTLIRRGCWGDRRVGIVDTHDFRSFTPYEPCMQCDSCDGPLDELYGVTTVTDCGSVMVGTPLLYCNIKAARNSKFSGGSIVPQLAYSFDGHHWQRSLREPFIVREEGEGQMTWLSSVLRDEKGYLIYASTSDYAHGTGFNTPGTGRMRVYSLPENRFIGLFTDGESEGILITREFAWMGGELHINMQAQKATVAVLEVKMRDGGDVNIFSFGEPVPGFDHKDCTPFSGDSTDYVPEFAGGSLDKLKGKTIFFEIKLQSGAVYAISGDCVPLMNTEAARFRLLGVLPGEE